MDPIEEKEGSPSPVSNEQQQQQHSPFHFNSPFSNDFELVRILGHGAYGRVFEARKRIDQKHYAVKRIKLPGNKEARSKVMREVTVSWF